MRQAQPEIIYHVLFDPLSPNIRSGKNKVAQRK